MKSNIRDYPEFLEAMERERLVYLFGTGISSALTGKPYSWYRWIVDGIGLLPDKTEVRQLREELDAEDTAENMVRVVGELLVRAKAEGIYEPWMQQAFETAGISDEELARTLEKIRMTQDVTATTNYDLLLEKATGSGTLTYEQPDEIFSMLDKGISTHVLHLHGAYDSVNKIDNIIADEEQYQAIYNNEGAQFIQNLLGTRTLIFVGCGQTTDDINIGRFIRFAREHLKLDIPYYFLYRSGEHLPTMPDNIRQIPYGDAYGDLPEFLKDMVQVRMEAFMKTHPLVGRTVYRTEKLRGLGLMGYHYAQEQVSFHGRDKELRELTDFLDQKQEFSWWAITGQAGSGKSRLALELLKRVKRQWFGFFINDRAGKEQAQEYVPFCDTVVLLDYVKGREEQAADICRILMDSFQKKGYRLRILFLEREKETKAGSWYAVLSSQFGRYDQERFQRAEYFPAGMPKDTDDSHEFIFLEDLEENAVLALIGEVCHAHGLPEDMARDRMLRQEYGRKFEKLRYRPLYVQIYVEAWIENDCVIPRYDRFETLLEDVLKREQERWLAQVEGDVRCCNALIRLLVRAGAADGLKLSQIPDLYQEDWHLIQKYLKDTTFAGKQRRENLEMLLSDVGQSMGAGTDIILPLYPDILKEYMLVFYTEPEDLPAVAAELWEHEGMAFSRYMRRCLMDFPDHEGFLKIIKESSENTADLNILGTRLALLEKTVIRPEDTREQIMAQINEEYAFWHNIALPEGEGREEIAIVKFAGLMLAARQYGGWVEDSADRMMKVIYEAAEISGGEELDILKSYALGEQMTELSKAGFAEEAGALREMIQKLTENNGLGKLLELQNLNAEMMEWLVMEDFEEAYAALEEMASVCDMEEEAEAESLSFSCFNLASFGFMCRKPDYISKALLLTEPLYKRYPDNPGICGNTLKTRMQDIQYRFFSRKRSFKKDTAIQKEADTVIQEMDAHPMGAELSEVWAMIHIFRLNFLEKNPDAVQEIITKAEELLEELPDADTVAQTYIRAAHMLHKNILHDQVPIEQVEQAFAYMNRFVDSESIREAFFDMLKDSEEAENRSRYLTKRIRSAAIQDARMNPWNSSGVEEIDEMFGVY